MHIRLDIIKGICDKVPCPARKTSAWWHNFIKKVVVPQERQKKKLINFQTDQRSTSTRARERQQSDWQGRNRGAHSFLFLPHFFLHLISAHATRIAHFLQTSRQRDVIMMTCSFVSFSMSLLTSTFEIFLVVSLILTCALLQV